MKRSVPLLAFMVVLGSGLSAKAVPIEERFNAVLEDVTGSPIGFPFDLPTGSLVQVFVAYDSSNVDTAVPSGIVYAFPARWGLIHNGNIVLESDTIDSSPYFADTYILNALTLSAAGRHANNEYDFITVNLTTRRWIWEDQSGHNYIAGSIIGVVPEPTAAVVFAVGLLAIGGATKEWSSRVLKGSPR